MQTEIEIVPKPTISKGLIFSELSDEELLSFGVPVEWLTDVKVATEDTLLLLTDHLPSEAAEALLELATGGNPRPTQLHPELNNPFDHPDAQRRFRVMANIEELSRALDFPWEKWTIFLHPEQRQLVERDYTGPARVSGSAGTGKTIVALHRAVHLARSHPEARVLLTTFSDTLANALRIKLKRLLGNEPLLAERIDVYSLNSIGLRLYKSLKGTATIAFQKIIRDLIEVAKETVGGNKFSLQFLLTEWDQVVDGWQLENWDEYRDVVRLGRKTRLLEEQRKVLWAIFNQVRAGLQEQKLTTYSSMFSELAVAITKNKHTVFDYAVVDESQDISVSHVRFFAALGGGRPNALFFAGDLGQRIFQQPFSWKSLNVDVRGRSRTLRVNYRTSHQIRIQADRLLQSVVTDVDGNSKNRSDTVSIFNGLPPTICSLKSEIEEIDKVSHWIKEQTKAGLLAHEFGVIVRSDVQLDRAVAAVKKAGLKFKILDEKVESTTGQVSVCTMHLAKSGYPSS